MLWVSKKLVHFGQVETKIKIGRRFEGLSFRRRILELSNLDNKMTETTPKSKSIYSFLAKIQRELKAPKGQFNKFANFYYRSCEDILEAVKPLLGNYCLTISDEVMEARDRYYIKATARLSNGKEFIENVAFARETDTKKGMDASQITGAASSYARKYALNGLFAIDDTRDADSDVERKNNKESSQEYETMATPKQIDFIDKLCKQRGSKSKNETLKMISEIADTLITSSKEITKEQASKIIDSLQGMPSKDAIPVIEENDFEDEPSPV